MSTSLTLGEIMKQAMHTANPDRGMLNLLQQTANECEHKALLARQCCEIIEEIRHHPEREEEVRRHVVCCMDRESHKKDIRMMLNAVLHYIDKM